MTSCKLATDCCIPAGSSYYLYTFLYFLVWLLLLNKFVLPFKMALNQQQGAHKFSTVEKYKLFYLYLIFILNNNVDNSLLIELIHETSE